MQYRFPSDQRASTVHVLAAIAALLFLPNSCLSADDKSDQVMQVAIDATNLPRRLLKARVTIPIAEKDANVLHELALWYPKWVPGAHAPGGPIANVAGLKILDDQDQPLEWKRSPGEVFRLLVEVPAGVRTLQVHLLYITNQPSTNSIGVDSFGSDLLGLISPNTVLVYPEGADIDRTQAVASLRLPRDWVAASALPAQPETQPPVPVDVQNTDRANTPTATAVVPENAESVTYHPVSLRTLVDSPIMCGRYYRAYDLVEPAHRGRITPHTLHVFSEAESVLKIDDTLLQRFRQMVTQATLLFGGHPFDEFDVLLATTDQLPANGLEHSQSSMNILGQRDLQAIGNLKGWDRLLIPHEYVHAWCGKYRIPQGMLTHDFHTPLDTELLWVYEGLTQYLGELLEARCGLMTPDEFQHRLTLEIRHAMYQQGRQWRSLADTGAAAHILRAGSNAWPRLRRSQDYYMEGMLMWLEVDALIRRTTNGEKTLDDFCQRFFACDDAGNPRGFSQDDVVTALQSVTPYDWAGLLHRRIQSRQRRFNPDVVDHLGYMIQYTPQKPKVPKETYRYIAGIDAYDSLGVAVANDGVVRDLLLGSPADNAALGPGMRIAGVNGHTYSVNRLHDAIAMSGTMGSVELMVVSGDTYKTLRIKYDGGPRYLTLVPKSEGDDLLQEILSPRTTTDLQSVR